jgi:hypothetical protein
MNIDTQAAVCVQIIGASHNRIFSPPTTLLPKLYFEIRLFKMIPFHIQSVVEMKERLIEKEISRIFCL